VLISHLADTNKVIFFVVDVPNVSWDLKDAHVVVVFLEREQEEINKRKNKLNMNIDNRISRRN
jgi:hypothetical protein